jgi:hypothetical protein
MHSLTRDSESFIPRDGLYYITDGETGVMKNIKRQFKFLKGSQ